MHFEVLVEDQSGKKALDSLIPKIIGPNDTFRVLSYKGIGHIPKGLKGNTDPAKRALLNRLPELLSGYGKTPFYHPSNNTGAVIFVCDLDERCLKDFRAELLRILEGCEAQPIARFCIAIKEGESWLLGDIAAIKAAYPNAKEKVLKHTLMRAFPAHGRNWRMRFTRKVRRSSNLLAGKPWGN